MRLNKEIRQKIVDNAYKASSIPAAKKELTRRSMELSEKVRIASFGEHGDLTDKIKALEAEFKALIVRRGIPENYDIDTTLRSRSYAVYCKLGEGYKSLRFDGTINEDVYVYGGKGKNQIVGHLSGSDLHYPADHEYTQEYRAICNEAKELDSKEETIRNTVAATLESFKTVEKLLEEWPEAKILIPKEVEAASKPLPLALQTENLNLLIGLPK